MVILLNKEALLIFFVFYNQTRFAIEFDNGNLLKLKSIAKLLQSSSKYKIGIVRGNQRYNVWNQNLRRITYVMKRLQLQASPILLIINSDKTAGWIKNTT